MQQTVLDILCAHIRQTTGAEAYRREHGHKPSGEIQSLLTLLFVKSHCIFNGCYINIQEVWLNGADLRDARLSKADLVNVHLREASLSDACLHESDLLDADLKGACLIRAGLLGVNLNGASVQASVLSHANLQGSIIENAGLHGADLSSAFLQGASLAFGALQGANLAGARLEEAGMKNWNKLTPFADRIRESIGQRTNLSTNVFANGLTREQIDSLAQGLSESRAENLRSKLMSHIGGSASHKLPEGSGANTRSYTQEEAEKWIAEYHKAVSVLFEDKC